MSLRATTDIDDHGPGSAPPNKPAVWGALAQLRPEDFLALAAFAARQLRRVGLPAASAEDIVQQSLTVLAVGAGSVSRGRHPRRADLARHEAFLNYLRGVISSLVDGQRSLIENRFQHSVFPEGQLELVLGPEDPAGSSVRDEAAYNELSGLLYQRLSQRVPPRLQRLLLAWRDQHFQSDHIPVDGGHRRLRAELRALAAKVLADLLPRQLQHHQRTTRKIS